MSQIAGFMGFVFCVWLRFVELEQFFEKCEVTN